MIVTDSIETMAHPKGSLFTASVFDGQVSFYTRLQVPTRDSTKLITLKIDPGAQVNTIPPEQVLEALPSLN